MKTSLSNSNWLIIVAAVAAVAAYAYFSFLPGQKSLDRLRAELAAAEQFIGQVEAFGSAVQATQQEFDKTQKYTHQWDESAPSEARLAELFGRINRLAKESGTTTTRFAPEKDIAYARIRRRPVVMACVGPYGKVCEFLHALESLDETIWVEKMEMERTGEGGEEGGDVHCEITLAIFADNPDDSDQVDRSE